MVDYQISSRKITAWVRTDATGVITEAAPVLRKFIGQRLCNLSGWMESQGEVKLHILSGRDR